MGLKDECIELIKLGYNPNEVDTLNRNSYYWADYYKYDNNEIDSEWLENIYLKYKQDYEQFQFNMFLQMCQLRLEEIAKFKSLLSNAEDEQVFKAKYLSTITSKLSSSGAIVDAFKLVVPSLFLSNYIGKVSKSHKKFPLHFIVKAMIFKKEEEKYSCGILFGKWLVKYNNESGLIDVEPFSGSEVVKTHKLELIYSTDLFRVDQQINNHYDQQMLDNFIYNFAQFCCWWNGLALDNEIYNSFYFVYCAIKYFDFEKNLKEHDILIPFIKNIIIYDNCILYYNPPSDFISTIRDIINYQKGKVNNDFWDYYYNLILNNNNDIVIEFDELEDIESYLSFIEYYYPEYLHEQQSKQSLGVLRNILISNKLKFEEFNMKSKELFCNDNPNFSGDSITRIKYHIGNSLDSVIEGKVIPEEFKESENVLVKYTSDYCSQVFKTLKL